jgi:hypothetical protein
VARDPEESGFDISGFSLLKESLQEEFQNSETR